MAANGPQAHKLAQLAPEINEAVLFADVQPVGLSGRQVVECKAVERQSVGVQHARRQHHVAYRGRRQGQRWGQRQAPYLW